jgi:methyltransferase (TIGR00027 family)
MPLASADDAGAALPVSGERAAAWHTRPPMAAIVGGAGAANQARRLAMAQPHDPLRGVGKTALGVAMVRARESRRADRLFDDPFAQAFVDAAPGAFPEPRTSEELAALGPVGTLGAAFYTYAVIRTRFFDDYLTAAVAAGCSQVVLLAAGLDTRAFRLAWPKDTRVFEVDLPDVLAFKDTVLTAQGAVPRCARATVPADLRGDWTAALATAGFDHAQRRGWPKGC